ncbi:hypothetical protein ACEZDB_16400 [Streptacidiphilus sp. N1-3]|uniref:Uncharacterized protein n=1 Tax=Streptacidiphilus alkalitolerans TaxID=3342712 RepID=A0ABV6X1R6_9ACTN
MLLEQKRHDQRHRQRLAWAELIAQSIGHATGLAALVVLAVVAWHAFDVGAKTQGAAIICTGAVSIVAVFVTGRRSADRRAATPQDEPAPRGAEQ